VIEVEWKLGAPALRVGILEATGVTVGPASDRLEQTLDEEIARRRQAGPLPAELRQEIRDLLRRGGFRPTGRSKPASEYLANAAQEGQFPRINNLVDINNLLSLRTGWPMSLLDLDRILGDAPSARLELRLGRAGESYVFNPAGQAIELAGLLLLAGPRGAAGNPVKDALETKITAATRRVLGVIYTSRRLASADQLAQVAGDFAALLQREGGARQVEVRLLAEEAARVDAVS